MRLQVPDWRDGVVLKAQHFQLLQSNIEDASRNCMINIHPHHYGYGVLDVEIDESRIRDNLVSVHRVQVIFPDGTFVKRSCNLSVHIPTATQNVFLYLGVATESSEHKLRYDSYSASVRDWHSADFAQIDCVEHKLQLFVAAEPPAGYSCVPLARILSSKLDPDYAAPMLCVDNRTCAYHKVLEFIGFLRSKVDGISRTHPVLPSLVESVIEIEALLKMKGVHPANLYIAMIKLVARSNALCATYMIPPFIPYKHNDVMRTFGYIMHHVRDNLSNVRDVDSVGLEYRQGKFYADIRPEYQFEENMLAIGIEFRDQSNRDITEWIKHAIIEGGGMQASLRRVLGAPRGLVNKINKLGLEERSNFLLAVVGVDGDYLSASDTLCIYNPSDTESQPDNIRIMFAGRAAE